MNRVLKDLEVENKRTDFNTLYIDAVQHGCQTKAEHQDSRNKILIMENFLVVFLLSLSFCLHGGSCWCWI